MNAFSCPPLNHLDRMTDSTGLIQHCIYNVPRRESGYTTDDNARALRLCSHLYDQFADDRMLDRVTCYLSFLEHARCPDGAFHNFMSYQRAWLDISGCGDSQGQAVLSLATVLASSLPQGFRDLARELIDGAIPVLTDLTSLRAHAYVVQAWAVLSRASVPNMGALEKVARQAADLLVEAWLHSQCVDWQWFEPRLTYANAVLPHALFDAAECWSDEKFLAIADRSYCFLNRITTAFNVFWPIGNLGWCSRVNDKSLYDQQPVEASTMAAAALAALRLTKKGGYLITFHNAHGWFHGQNNLNFTMADTAAGGCLDGLQTDGANRNQGAESTLAFLWTEVLAQEVKRDAFATGGVIAANSV